MKAYGGMDVQIHIFLTSALVGGEWSASRPGRFTPGERVPGTHWIGGWVDPRPGLDDVEKRTFLTLPGLELRSLGRPARSQYGVIQIPYFAALFIGCRVKSREELHGIVSKPMHLLSSPPPQYSPPIYVMRRKLATLMVGEGTNRKIFKWGRTKPNNKTRVAPLPPA
jgi:hypothetical protein